MARKAQKSEAAQKASQLKSDFLPSPRALIAASAVFAKATGTSLPMIGRKVLNDTKFFSRIADGKDCTVGSYRKVVAHLRDNWPPEVNMPAAVEAAQVMR